MGTLSGKVALITGGSRGLGLEMARAFAEEGSHIAVASRKLANCEAVATELASTFGVDAAAFSFNASNWEQCSTLVEQVYERFGKVDTLVNNAGMSPLYESLVDVDSLLFDKVIGVNLRAPFRLISLIGTRMKAAGGGSIINVSSVEAVRPHPGALPYAAAKAGLNALTVGFAEAFAPTVRVNAIQAGGFLTDISQSWTAEMRADMEKGTMLGRAGQPSEITGAALYLASAASAYSTGSILRVDGGLL
jgi:NAD(P)-dependent dehydrogenase (short-subunit alcohol dehydrogenase family)